MQWRARGAAPRSGWSSAVQNQKVANECTNDFGCHRRGDAGAGREGAAGQTIVVGAGGNLQAALNQAQPGQTVQLQAGATFDGNFVLPAKTGTAYITVRTSTPDSQLPGATTRIDLSHEPLLATIRSINAMPGLRTAAGAHHWRLIGLRFTTTGASDVVALGDAVAAGSDTASRPTSSSIAS